LHAWSSVLRVRCIVARAGLLFAALTATRADARPRPIFEITPSVSDAGFGTALAVAGDALVVGGGGSSGGSGRVSVFDLGTGQPRLVLAGPGGNDGFGFRVAATDDAIVVSAPGNHVAYLFDHSGRLRATLPSDLVELDEDRFGAQLAVGGGYVAVGGSTSGIRLFDATSGAFLRTVSVSEDWTGMVIVPSHDTVFVGVAWPFDDVGRVYAFDPRSGELRWRHHGPLERPGFGQALALDRGNLVVGAWRDAAGRACVGLGDPVVETLRPICRRSRPGASFGAAVAIRGDRILIGAPDAARGNGRAYLYSRRTGGRLATYDAGATSGAGTAVALNRGRAIIGARGGVAVFRARVP
jgi:outer membrane protein assembly factor BamB